MDRPIFLLLLTVLLAAASSSAAAPFTMKSESNASESPGRQTIVNTSFAFVSLYNAEQKNFTNMLISQRIESTNHSGVEGADSHLEAIAWITGKTTYDTKLWVIKDSGERGEELGDFYRTTKYGCCGAEQLHRAYNLKTGQYIFSFTAEPAFIDVPNTSIKRNISYVSANAASDGPVPSGGIGALTLSSNDSRIDSILLESDDGELAWSPKLLLVDKKEVQGASRLSLWHSNRENKAEAVGGFSVKLFFDDGMVAIIPVNGDKFDIQKASLPKTITIKRISAE